MSKNICLNCEKGPVQCYYTEDALIECKYFKEKDFDSIIRGLKEVKAMQESKYGEWISVKDRLPSKDGLVLTYAPSKDPDEPYVYEAWYDSKNGWCLLPVEVESITHWMPLPEPPKEV